MAMIGRSLSAINFDDVFSTDRLLLIDINIYVCAADDDDDDWKNWTMSTQLLGTETPNVAPTDARRNPCP